MAELPGANRQGGTLDEARENLKEAVQLIIEVNLELARREMECSWCTLQTLCQERSGT